MRLQTTFYNTMPSTEQQKVKNIKNNCYSRVTALDSCLHTFRKSGKKYFSLKCIDMLIAPYENLNLTKKMQLKGQIVNEDGTSQETVPSSSQFSSNISIILQFTTHFMNN